MFKMIIEKSVQFRWAVVFAATLADKAATAYGAGLATSGHGSASLGGPQTDDSQCATCHTGGYPPADGRNPTHIPYQTLAGVVATNAVGDGPGLGDAHRVSPSPALFADLKQLLGPGCLAG